MFDPSPNIPNLSLALLHRVLEASGTSLDLKLKFGLGYQLQLLFPETGAPDPEASD